jgi:hypothetical protein
MAAATSPDGVLTGKSSTATDGAPLAGGWARREAFNT